MPETMALIGRSYHWKCVGGLTLLKSRSLSHSQVFLLAGRVLTTLGNCRQRALNICVFPDLRGARRVDAHVDREYLQDHHEA